MQIPSLLEVSEVTPATPDKSPTPLLMERRQRKSDLNRASEILSNAVDYLVSEQIGGRRTAVQANRHAIAILCDAGRELAKRERRGATRGAIDTWIRNAALFWAGKD